MGIQLELGLLSIPYVKPPALRYEYVPNVGLGPHLPVKAPPPGDCEVTPAVPESSRHLSPPVPPPIGRGKPAKCLAQGHNKRTRRPISIPTPAQGHNKRTRRPISTPTPQNAERQAGKLRTPTSKVPWSYCTRPGNRTLVHRPPGERSYHHHPRVVEPKPLAKSWRASKLEPVPYLFHKGSTTLSESNSFCSFEIFEFYI